MRKKLLSIVLSLALIATFMPMQTVSVVAASKAKTKQTVSTQSKLDKALKNKKLRTLTIRTKKKTGFNLKKGSHKKISVLVNASNASFDNTARFKKITLSKNAFQTWSEHARGNTITVNSKSSLITVSKDAAVSELNLNRKGSAVTLDVNGQVKKVNVNAKTKITINGAPSKTVLVKLSKKSVGATIANKTSSAIKVKNSKGTYSIPADMQVNVVKNADIIMHIADIPVPPKTQDEESNPGTGGGSGGGSTPQKTTFKAVFDTNNNANVLTLYYDNVNHQGEGKTVYDNLPTDFRPENYDEYNEEQMEKDFWGYYKIAEYVYSVVIDPSVANLHGLKSTYMMFDFMIEARSITGLEYLDVSQVTDMSWMFASFGVNVSDFTCVPNISNWKTGNVTKTEHMFYNFGCSSLELTTVPDFSAWDMHSLENAQDMFGGYGCDSEKLLFRLDLSKWDISSLDYSSDMFYCSAFSVPNENWQVIIPAKTGDKANTPKYWYLADWQYAVHPADGRSFTLASE